MGPSLEERRVIRTRGVLEFMEELDSSDTCLGRANEVLLPTVSLGQAVSEMDHGGGLNSLGPWTDFWEFLTGKCLHPCRNPLL